ncbi:MAG TPA: YlqD family protein [Bacillota bacterium]|nr:YlqD family protein [Bacillota bacterium]
MRIHYPVTVKVIVTEPFLAGLRLEIDAQIKRLLTEIDQIIYQQKLLSLEQTKNPKKQMTVQLQQLEIEKQKRLDAQQRMLERKKESLQLTVGSEVLHSKNEGSIEVAVGDEWQSVTMQEIILKDGIVVEIRSGRGFA